ncbi:MAG: ankyrin repeat domain-containing protein [Actinobacteria bacterium]|nr:ankyrin repeat domain-containing protein [Actinomycetota bacterium]
MPAGAEIFEAIESGDVERVRGVVAADPRSAGARDDEGVSAVLRALYHGRLELVDALVAVGPELDVHEASALGDLPRLRALLDGEPNLADSVAADGFTALQLAAFFSRPEAVRLLLERGADVAAAARNAMAVMPLHAAAARSENGIARLLLDAGAPVDAEQTGGYTPLHAAAANGNVELVRLLLERGADASHATAGGRTALELARERSEAEVVALLESR